MYELPQTLLHLTGPTLQGGPFVGSKLEGRLTLTDSLYMQHTLVLLEHEVLVQLCSWEQTMPFIIYHLPRNLPLSDAFYCHAPHRGPASNIVFMYAYGRRIMHAVSGRAAATSAMYHIPLPSLPLFIIFARIPIGQTSRFFLSVAYFCFGVDDAASYEEGIPAGIQGIKIFSSQSPACPLVAVTKIRQSICLFTPV